MVWKVSSWSGKFPVSLEFFDSVESFWTVWKVSGQSEKFLKSLESFRIVYKVSGQAEKFPDNLRTLVHFGKTIYALLAYMSRKLFSHSVRKVFARKSLPTGKLRLFRSLQGVGGRIIIISS